MDKLKSALGSAVAVIYFIAVMWWLLLLLLLVPIMSFSDIKAIRDSGFSTSNVSLTFIGVFGFLIGLSLLIPPCRKMYHKLPWLFPYVKILFIDVIIMGIAITILNFGYEVQSNLRHNTFFVFMVAQIIICRILMCIYFSRNKAYHIGGSANE